MYRKQILQDAKKQSHGAKHSPLCWAFAIWEIASYGANMGKTRILTSKCFWCLNHIFIWQIKIVKHNRLKIASGNSINLVSVQRILSDVKKNICNNDTFGRGVESAKNLCSYNWPRMISVMSRVHLGCFRSFLGVIKLVAIFSPNSANWRGSSLEERTVWLTGPQLFAPVAYAKRYENNEKWIAWNKTYVKPME